MLRRFAFERVLVMAAVVLTAVVFDQHAEDPVNVVKLVLLLLCVIALVAAAAVRATRTRLLPVPGALAGGAAPAYALATIISALHASQGTIALAGIPGRNTGALAYVAGALLFAAVLTTFDAGATRLILAALLAGGAFTAAYGLLQRLGGDPIAWVNPFNPIIAALGNPDFASAYLGVAAPAALWVALVPSLHRALRIGGALLFAFLVLMAVLSHSIQGPIGAATGTGVLLLAWSLNQTTRGRRLGFGGLGAGFVLVVATLAAGAAHHGPAKGPFVGLSFQARTWYWETALTMFRRSPLLGVGPDHFGVYFPRDRPLAVPRRLGATEFSDAAHSVPLQHLAEGGLLLALAYLFLLVVVVLALVRGLRTKQDEDRLLVGGLGGAWVAYQVQSLVSIDQIALLVLNFVLGAAVVVAASDAAPRQVRLPGAPAVPVQTGKRKGRAAVPAVRRPTGADVAVSGVVVLAALFLAWLALTPLRAARASYQGDLALVAGHGDPAIKHYQDAQRLMSGYGVYWSKSGEAYNSGGLTKQARDAFLKAFDHDKTALTALRNAASLSENLGEADKARQLYQRLLPYDPSNDVVITNLGGLDLSQGRTQDALKVLEDGARKLPADADVVALLGKARFAAGDVAGAKAAWQQAIRLVPSQPTAVAGLQELAKQKP